MQGVVNLRLLWPVHLLVQSGCREVFNLIQAFAPFLNASKDAMFLIFRGSSFYDLAALHPKLSWVIYNPKSLVCLRSPLSACLVLYLYSEENMECRYWGTYSVWLCTLTPQSGSQLTGVHLTSHTGWVALAALFWAFCNASSKYLELPPHSSIKYMSLLIRIPSAIIFLVLSHSTLHFQCTYYLVQCTK